MPGPGASDKPGGRTGRGDPGATTWLTLKEASEAAGVSVSWLRKQYRRQALPTREVPGPRGPQKLVPLEQVHILSAAFTHQERGPGEGGAAPATRTASNSSGNLVDRLVQSETRAARAETDSAHLRARLEAALAEIRRLRRLLAEAYDPPMP